MQISVRFSLIFVVALEKRGCLQGITEHEMNAVAKIYHSIPIVELISFSLVSHGFVLFFFFFPLLVLYVFALFRRNVFGW